MADRIGGTGGDALDGTEGDDVVFGDPYTTGNRLGAPQLGGALLAGGGAGDAIRGLGGRDTIFGDAWRIDGAGAGAGDSIDGGEDGDLLFGDARLMGGRALGAGDSLSGGDGDDRLYGDAFLLRDRSRGGDNSLSGGPGDDELYGDASRRAAGARGGDDLFQFEPGGGRDLVGDFEVGRDELDVGAHRVPGGVLAFDTDRDGTIGAGDRASVVRVVGGDLTLDLGAAAGGAGGVDTVTLAGVGALPDGDLIA